MLNTPIIVQEALDHWRAEGVADENVVAHCRGLIKCYYDGVLPHMLSYRELVNWLNRAESEIHPQAIEELEYAESLGFNSDP
jgi:hypothetical protein